MTMEWRDLESFTEGQIVVLTSGEYSQFGVSAVVRVLQPFDPARERSEWLTLHPEQTQQFKAYEFWAWLTARGVIEDMPYAEWHEGDTNARVYVETNTSS